VIGNLEVSLLTEGVHSGDGSGVVASSFRVLRQLLDRIEDSHTGQIKVEALATEIPRARIMQAARAAEVLGDEVWNKFPMQKGTQPVGKDNAELILNRTWRPALAITGVDDIPSIANGGNVMRPKTRLKLSMRIPPQVDAKAAAAALKATLEKDPPYGAHVKYEIVGANTGWNAPALAPWLEKTLETASEKHFGKPTMYIGEGGSIPYMGMLGEKFPKAQFCITGVLGPGSNAHGPNEFLHVPTAKKLTLCVADVLAAHAKQP
jgi:acetylornithine deacetylase/succinyl-diaminopimelate desuccinylase-like protein